MPGILYRYILRETVQTWLVVTLVLLLILVTNQFAEVLGDAAASKLPKEAVVRVMGLTSIQYLVAFSAGHHVKSGLLSEKSELSGGNTRCTVSVKDICCTHPM